MPTTAHESLVYRKRPLARALVALNLTLGALVVVAWQTTMLFFLDPLSWASHYQFTSNRDYIVLLQYPLALFWFGPAVAVGVGWVAMRAHNYKTAVTVMVAPVLAGLLIFALYWFLPSDVR